MSKARKLLNTLGEDMVQTAADSIARKAALNPKAVAKLIKDNKFDPAKLAQMVSSGKIDPLDDIMIALVGNDKSRKKAITKIKGMLK